MIHSTDCILTFYVFSQDRDSTSARRATGADIPPELFPNIIRHLAVSGLREWDLLPSSLLHNYTLVCTYWAQECRRRIYHERTIWIASEESAKRFRELVVSTSSKRLTPFVELIAEVIVGYHILGETPRNRCRYWHHILGFLVPLIPAHKFRRLSIEVLAQSEKQRTPHWTLSRPLSSSVMPFRELHLSYLHFQALRNLLRLLHQLPRLEQLVLTGLTWGDDNVPARRSPTAKQRAQPMTHSLRKIALDGCQDNHLLFPHLVQSGRDGGSLLRTLSDVEGLIVAEVMGSAYAAHLAILGDANPNISYTQKLFGEYRELNHFFWN